MGRNEAASVRSRWLLRTRWPAAVAVGVAAGLAGGAIVALLTAAHDTAGALDAYIQRIDSPDGFVALCPAGSSPADDDAGCARYDPVDETRVLGSDHRVAKAGRVAATPLGVRVAGGEWQPAFAYVALDGAGLFGKPPVESGREADPSEPGEAMVNRTMAESYGIEAGDHLEVGVFSWDQFDRGALNEDPQAWTGAVEVTGVLRTPLDLEASVDTQALQLAENAAFLGPGFASRAGEFASFASGIAVQTGPGTDLDALVADVLPGRVAIVEGGVWDLDSIDAALDYEARAAQAAAAVAGIAVAVFVGLMVARQARRELEDADALRALGATRSLVVRSTAARWAISGALAVATAAVVAVLARPLGPVGLARTINPTPSFSLHGPLAAAGLALLGLFVVAVALATTWRAARPGKDRHRAATTSAAVPFGPPAALAGVRLATLPDRRRNAVIAIGVVSAAVATAVAAATVGASLADLGTTPEQFGAAWDVSIAVDVTDGPAEIERAVGRAPGVVAVATLVGNEGSIGGDGTYTYAFEPVPGQPEGIQPIVTEGRPPVAPGEVALGALSMRRAGVELGDTVTLTYLGRDHELEVVGVALVNDNYEDLPGVGAVVPHTWLRQFDNQSSGSDLMLRFDDDLRDAGVASILRDLPRASTIPVAHPSIRNLQRIDRWPALLAVLVAVLALVTLAHAMVGGERRQRRQLAVLKALGFSRPQTGACVAWQAAVLVAVAVAVGVPLGVVVGRWGWGRLADGLGVPSIPVVPLAGLTLVTLAAVVAVATVAVPFIVRAGRLSPAAALRAE